MNHVRILICSGLLAAFSVPAHAYDGRHGAPAYFNPDGASAIGSARQHYDRREYRRYRGDPGAQFILKQKRRNLCRNNPEMC